MDRPVICFVLAAVALSGCAVGPDYRSPTPPPVPDAFISAAATPRGGSPGPQWWASLDDPTLQRLVERALAGNFELRTAEARIREARALRNVAAGVYSPTLEAGGAISRDSASRNGEQFADVPRGAQNTFTDYRAGFDATWEIDLFGRSRRVVEGADARVEASVEERSDVALRISAEVASLYVDYRVSQQRSVVLARGIQIEEETVRLVRAQAAAGTASELEVKRAESEWRSSRARLPTLEAESRVTLHSLAILLGDAPTALAKELVAVGPIPPVPAMVPGGLPSDMVRRRPDLRAAERTLAAATADIGVAVADQFPRFDLVGTVGLDAVHSGSFADAASRYWSIGPRLSLPLFEGGRLKSTVQAREAERDQAMLVYRDTVLRALADVESSLVRFEEEGKRKRELDEGSAASERAITLAEDRFRAGETALTEVLDVQRQFNALADERVLSSGQLAQDYVALSKALGGGATEGK